MAAGYDLKNGKYDQSVTTVREIKTAFSKFFERSSRKESTYKYVMFKSIIDCMNIASDRTYKITFDSLFCRFSEIYWVLVFKYRIPQKLPSILAPETMAEKIVKEIAKKYKLKRKTAYSDLSNTVKHELVSQMKKKCSKYVFGALYTETDQLFYSFSKEKEWIKLNPVVVAYINKHMNNIQTQNYHAWAKFYTEILMTGDTVSHYKHLLKKEFDNNRVLLCADPNTTSTIAVMKRNDKIEGDCAYGLSIAEKTRRVLMQYPDIGLYVAQISEKIGENKEQVRDILDHSYWSSKEGSRYFYRNITNEEIINDALFSDDVDVTTYACDDTSYEIDEEDFSLLDNPELLIKKLRQEKKASVSVTYPQKRIDGLSVSNDTPSRSAQKKWVREEVVILVVEYFNSKSLGAGELNDLYKKISSFLRKREEIISGNPVDDTFRNVAGIQMQYGRIKCIDPDTEYSGMKGTDLQKKVVAEYLEKPALIIDEAKRIYEKYST